MIDLCRPVRNRYNNTKKKIRYFYNSLFDRSPKLTILLYHRVIPGVKFDPFHTTVSLKTFERQIGFLAQRYTIISLGEAIRQCQSGMAKEKNQIILTFDDGYLEDYEIIYPLLKKSGLPATFFLVAGSVGQEIPLWDCEVTEILYNNKAIRRIEIAGETILQKVMQSRSHFVFTIIEKMKSLNKESRQDIISTLKERIRQKNIPGDAHDKCVTWKQAKEMADNGMEIGSHSLSHCALARIPFKEARQEIMESKKIIENNIKKECLHFAFPFGSQRDYNQELIDYVRNAGFQSCLLNIPGYNRLKKDAFCFKRIIIEESTNLEYLLG